MAEVREVAPWISDEEIVDAVETARERGVAVALRVKDASDLPPGAEFAKMTNAMETFRTMQAAGMVDDFYGRVQDALASVEAERGGTALPLGTRTATPGAIALLLGEDTKQFYGGGNGLVPIGLPDKERFARSLIEYLGDTPGEKRMEVGAALRDLLRKQAACEWGDTPADDVPINDAAAKNGERIVASHDLAGGRLWLITEWDRSTTTILLPDEY